MHRRKINRTSGFTLIELLVVIAIIAILAAILFPVFAQARAAARKANGLSMTKQVATAILMYNQDYDEKFPRSGWSCQGPFADGTQNSCNELSWPNVVAPYHKNAQIVEDPADVSSFGDPTYSNGKHTLLYNDLLSHQPCVTDDGSADFNCGDGSSGADPNNNIHPQKALSQASVTSPADCVMVTEGFCPWGGGDGVTPNWTGKVEPAGKDKWESEQSMSQYQAILITGTNYGGWSAFKGLPIHQGGTIYAYTDGHAKYAKAFDPGMAGKAPYYGNVLHSTLPFRKNYDPQQHRPDLPVDLRLGGRDNWN